jgi:hypothetical protein
MPHSLTRRNKHFKTGVLRQREKLPVFLPRPAQLKGARYLMIGEMRLKWLWNALIE